VNDFLPLSVAPEIVTGLALGLVVHEGGHGLMCRVEDIDVESVGLAFLTVVPVGAFVEPDEEDLRLADRGAQLRMYTAGVTNNFAIALVALILLFGPVMGAFAVVDGAPVGGVQQGTPAASAGIEPGAVVTGVDGTPVSGSAGLSAALANATGETAELTLASGETVTVDRSVVVTSASPRAPVGVNSTITAVNGTGVNSEREFMRAAGNHSLAELTFANGETRTVPLGALGRVTPDAPLDEAGATAEADLVVTHIDGQRTLTPNDLQAVLDGRPPGEQVTVVGYLDGSRVNYTVTMGEGPADGDGIIGIDRMSRGVSGFSVSDFGIDPYPAGAFLELLGGDAGDDGTPAIPFTQRVFTVLLLPFAGAGVGAFGYNFAGFTGFATNFYEVQGPLGAFGDGPAFLLANLLFWTGWINLVIGQFNLIPSYPLDGGHILRACSESIIARLPIDNKRTLTSTVTGAVTIAMLIGLVVMLFGPQYLA
jgi:membrane-associated protease RseP (regulator of RpoE activity)